jgi:hypothetical protein
MLVMEKDHLMIEQGLAYVGDHFVVDRLRQTSVFWWRPYTPAGPPLQTARLTGSAGDQPNRDPRGPRRVGPPVILGLFGPPTAPRADPIVELYRRTPDADAKHGGLAR